MSQQDKTKPMNLLILFSDEHNHEVTGCYGNPYIKTPNLDRLAAQGTLFRNAYSNCPICVPARATLANGDYNFKGSYWDNCHPYCGKEPGWGHRLEENGVRVTTIGKLHYKGDIPETGFKDQRIPLNVRDGVGDVSHVIRDGTMRRPWLADEIRNAGERNTEYLQYDAKVAELAVKFLEEESKEIKEPWCLFVGFVLPHYPLGAPKEYMDLYRPYDKIPLPKGWAKDQRSMHPALEYMRREFHTHDIDDDSIRKAVATYYAMITYMDDKVGLVLDALDRAGLRDNTRIIYTNDHGDTMGDHGLVYKMSMYEGSVGVPLIMAGPDIPAGKVVEDDVSLIDFFPTVLECTGVEPTPEDKKLPGMSLLEWAKRDIKPLQRPIFSEYHALASEHASFMIKQGDYKFIYYVTHQPQLFNLKDDPDEMCDLAPDPKYAATLSRMEGLLREICDPEKVNEQARREQNALLEKHGGKEKVLQYAKLSYSPVPKTF